jgi:hypothetical protein
VWHQTHKTITVFEIYAQPGALPVEARTLEEFGARLAHILEGEFPNAVSFG